MDTDDNVLRSVLLSEGPDVASDGRASAPSPRHDRIMNYPMIGPTSKSLDNPRNDRGMVYGGVRVHRDSRQPQYLEQLSRYQATQLRVWRCLHGPLDRDDLLGRFVYILFQVAVILFVVLSVLETEDKVYKRNRKLFDGSAIILAIIITLDWVLSVWSVVANVASAEGNAPTNRLQWCMKPLPAIDLIVIVSFWLYQILYTSETQKSVSSQILGSLRTLRMLRLLQIFELTELRRIKRAFKIVHKVLISKGDDLLAALLLMTIAVTLIATGMFLIEGASHDHDDLRSFSSIPVSMYWAVTTITTIGFGDIVPETTGGQIFCTFVGLFAVCIGSIPIAIIGAGYVEELDIIRKEEALAATQQTSEVFMNILSASAQGSGNNFEQRKEDNTSETLAGLKLYLSRAADPTFLSKVDHNDLDEVQLLLQKASTEVTSYVMSELALLRRHHHVTGSPM